MATWRARLAALAVGSVLVVGVAACGSSDSSDSDPTTTTAKPAETTETTAATEAEGATDSSESTDDMAVKNAPLNNCISVQSGARPTTAEAREAMRKAQQDCVARNRSTTTVKR